MNIKLQKFLDKHIFSIPCNMVKIKKTAPIKVINKILIIKLWALGDSVVLLPTLEVLKKAYPKAEIHVLAHRSNMSIFEGQKFIDKIIPFNILNVLDIMLFHEYDLCIDAEPFLNVSAVIGHFAARYQLGFNHGIRKSLYNGTIEFNKKQHMVQNYLDFARKLGIKCNAKKLVPLIINDADFCQAWDFTRRLIYDKDYVIGICPGVAESVKYRMWPEERMAELADRLIKNTKWVKIIFIDSKDNKPAVDRIISMMKEKNKNSINVLNAAGLFNVKQSAQIINNCNIFVGNDSGMMHIAAAMGVKTVGLFGCNTHKLWGPYGKKNISIYKYKEDCPFIDNTNPNLIPEYLTEKQKTCMDSIKVKDVYKHIR